MEQIPALDRVRIRIVSFLFLWGIEIGVGGDRNEVEMDRRTRHLERDQMLP